MDKASVAVMLVAFLFLPLFLILSFVTSNVDFTLFVSLFGKVHHLSPLLLQLFSRETFGGTALTPLVAIFLWAGGFGTLELWNFELVCPVG